MKSSNNCIDSIRGGGPVTLIFFFFVGSPLLLLHSIHYIVNSSIRQCKPDGKSIATDDDGRWENGK